MASIIKTEHSGIANKNAAFVDDTRLTDESENYNGDEATKKYSSGNKTLQRSFLLEDIISPIAIHIYGGPGVGGEASYEWFVLV